MIFTSEKIANISEKLQEGTRVICPLCGSGFLKVQNKKGKSFECTYCKSKLPFHV